VNPGGSGAPWIVWILQSAGADGRPEGPGLEAARLVARNCHARGMGMIPVFEIPPAEPGGILQSSAAVLAAAACPLPSDALTDRLFFVGAEPAEAPAHSVSAHPNDTPTDIALRILSALEEAGFIPHADEDVYTEEEEERLRKALDDLGYL